MKRGSLIPVVVVSPEELALVRDGAQQRDVVGLAEHCDPVQRSKKVVLKLKK